MKETVDEVTLVRIGTAVPFRVWTGDGPFSAPEDDPVDPGATYLDSGLLIDMPSVRQILDGLAERVDIGFSGIDPVPCSWVDDPESDIDGAPVNIGVLKLDSDGQPNGAINWLWFGVADVPTYGYENGVESISLSVGSTFVDRARARRRMWTLADHKRRHPTDNLPQLISRYNRARTKVWPK